MAFVLRSPRRWADREDLGTQLCAPIIHHHMTFMSWHSLFTFLRLASIS